MAKWTPEAEAKIKEIEKIVELTLKYYLWPTFRGMAEQIYQDLYNPISEIQNDKRN